jgi:hypothetical protein
LRHEVGTVTVATDKTEKQKKPIMSPTVAFSPYVIGQGFFRLTRLPLQGAFAWNFPKNVFLVPTLRVGTRGSFVY